MKQLLLTVMILVFSFFCVSAENIILEPQQFYSLYSEQPVAVNLEHPSEEDIKLIIGNSTNHEIMWIDENNYNLTWEEKGVFQTLATFGALTIPSDATYISSTSGCKVWYSPQESYNRANSLSSQSNYQYYVSSETSSGWHGIHNQINPNDLCSYWLYNMSDSCSIKSQWQSQCLNKTSSYCNAKDGYGPWQIMCPNISTLAKYNSRKNYNFSPNSYGYCYIYSMSNQDEYLGQCSSSCYFGICDGGNECTGVNCGANAYCSSGTCYCSSGYGNCNGTFSDGCEANFNSDNYNCGYCNHYCGSGYQCISGSCVLQDPCAGVTCNNYCAGETRYFNGYCSDGSCIGYNTENCNSFDGYVCNANTKEYRDYYCSSNACNYSVSSSINCDSLDNYGDWEYYCSGNSRRQHRKFYDYSCTGNDCGLISSNYTDDQLTEECTYECVGPAPNAYCNNGCSGQLNIIVQDKQGTLLQNATVLVNAENKGTTNASGKLSVPTLSSDCGEIFSIKVVSAKGTDCGTKTTIINTQEDQDFIYFACKDPLPQIELDAVPGTFTYVLKEIINFSVTAFNEFSELLSNVGIGVIDPLLQTSFFNVIPVFPWTYSSTATSTGSTEFNFSAFKTGFEPDYKKVSVQVESLPSINVQVKDSQENPIENAKIYLDEELAGTTNSEGTKRIADVFKGPHSIEVQCANGKSCGTKSVVAVSGENTAEFRCGCLRDFDGDNFDDEGELLAGSDPTDQNNTPFNVLSEYSYGEFLEHDKEEVFDSFMQYYGIQGSSYNDGNFASQSITEPLWPYANGLWNGLIGGVEGTIESIWNGITYLRDNWDKSKKISKDVDDAVNGLTTLAEPEVQQAVWNNYWRNCLIEANQKLQEDPALEAFFPTEEEKAYYRNSFCQGHTGGLITEFVAEIWVGTKGMSSAKNALKEGILGQKVASGITQIERYWSTFKSAFKGISLENRAAINLERLFGVGDDVVRHEITLADGTKVIGSITQNRVMELGAIGERTAKRFASKYAEELMETAMKAASKNQGFTLTFVTGNPKEIIKVSDNFILSIDKDGKSLEIFKNVGTISSPIKSHDPVGQIDRLALINNTKPIVAESKSGSVSGFMDDLKIEEWTDNQGKIHNGIKTRKINPITELYGQEPELVVSVPKGEINYEIIHEIEIKGKGVITEFPNTTVNNFEEIGETMENFYKQSGGG